MEEYKENIQENNDNEENHKLINSKNYVLIYEQVHYSLIIELYSNDNLYFKLKKPNNLSFYYYVAKYNYNDITNLFLLQKEYYNDINKVLNFIDTALIKKELI